MDYNSSMSDFDSEFMEDFDLSDKGIEYTTLKQLISKSILILV